MRTPGFATALGCPAAEFFGWVLVDFSEIVTADPLDGFAWAVITALSTLAGYALCLPPQRILAHPLNLAYLK